MFAARQRLDTAIQAVALALHDRDESLWLLHRDEIVAGRCDFASCGFHVDLSVWGGRMPADIELVHAHFVHPVGYWVERPVEIQARVVEVERVHRTGAGPRDPARARGHAFHGNRGVRGAGAGGNTRRLRREGDGRAAAVRGRAEDARSPRLSTAPRVWIRWSGPKAKAIVMQAHANAKATEMQAHANAKATEMQAHANAKATEMQAHANAKATEGAAHANARATETQAHADAKSQVTQAHANAKSQETRPMPTRRVR